MTYTVKYRKLGSFFWKTVKRVQGDMIGNPQEFGASIRVLILEDESRLEIPADKTEFRYSPARHRVLLKNMEATSGQKLG